MNHAAELPDWVLLLTALCLLIGAALTLAGAVGTLRFRSFYDRVHAPTLGTSYGTAMIALASIIFFSVLESRLLVHELLIVLFVTVTTPVTLMMLARAALYRDRTEGAPGVPSRASLLTRVGLGGQGGDAAD